MVAALVRSREHAVGFGDDVVFQFAHGLEGHAGGGVESCLCAHQGLIWGAGKGAAVLVEETAQEAQGRNLGKRIDKGRPVAGNDVEVAVAGFHEGGEEAGSVDALAFGEDGLGIGEGIDREGQGLDAAVLGRIHEIDHADAVFADEAEQVRAGEILRPFLQEGDDRIGIQGNEVVHYLRFSHYLWFSFQKGPKCTENISDCK